MKVRHKIILGVQISSVRFFCVQKCIYFKTKWMNRLLIVHRCLFFPISQAIFEFHLEKMTRLWKWSNFGANFRFLRKKWTGDLLHPLEQPVIHQKEQCPENTAGAVKFIPFERFQIFFNDFRTWGRALSWRITLSCFCSYSSRFSRNALLKRINCSRYRSPVMESPDFSSS